MSQPSPRRQLRQARENESNGRNRAAASLYATVAETLLRRRHRHMAHFLAKRAVKLSPSSLKALWVTVKIESQAQREREMKQSLQLFARTAIRRKHMRFAAHWVEAQFKASPKTRRFFYEAVLGIERTTAFGFLGLASSYEDAGDWDAMNVTLLDALKTKSADKTVLRRLKRLYTRFKATEMLTHLERFEAAKLRRADLVVLLGGFDPVSPAPKVAVQEKNLSTLIAELEIELEGSHEDTHDKISPLVAEFKAKSDKILGSDGKARIDMALAFLEMDLFAAAEDELRHVSAEDACFGEAQCLLGGVLIKQGSELAALEVFQAVLRRDVPDSLITLEAHYQLVELYMRLGDIGQALIHLRLVERRNSGYRNLKSIKDRIESILGGRALAPDGPTEEQSGARKRKKAS